MISTVSIILAALVAVGFNGIINKIFIGNCSTKTKTIVGVIVDAVVGALVGYTITQQVIPTITTAVCAMAIADVGYDYIFKLIKGFITRLNSFKKVAEDPKELEETEK